MGLFDAYDPATYQGAQGGLLDRILASVAATPTPSAGFPGAQPSPLDNAQWPAGPVGAPTNANAAMPPAAPQPQNDPIAVGNYMMPRIGSGFDLPPGQLDPDTGEHVAPAPAAAPQPAAAPASNPFSSFMNRAADGLESVAHGGTILGALRGQPTDARSVQQRQLKAQYDAYVGAGIPPQLAQLAVLNPEAGKVLITQQFGPHNAENLGQGWIRDPQTGKVTRAYTPEQNDSFSMVQTGEDSTGNKVFQKMNKATGEMTPIASAPGADDGGGIGDTTKTGADYLATLPPQIRGTVLAVAEGRQAPPTGFAAAKPYWAKTVIPAVQQFDPSFDANNWAARHKLSTEMAASSNSSMGGILSNGKSSFKHLAEYTDSAADLGNASHDYLGGGIVAYGQNYIGNKLGGSDTQAKIKAINDNLGKYGAESTKFYSGTGGGVEERTAALHEMNPTTVSGEEMAAFAAKEKGLMLDRLREKEAQIRDTMGDAYLQKHPVFTPELQRDIARIDANVAKLRGGASGAAASGGTAPTGVKWSVVQ
jgi:hypothetical protein